MKVHNEAPLIVISGAVGSGKGTILYALTNELELNWIPTATTRPPRSDDGDLSRRHFLTDEIFDRHLARGDFFESVHRASARYGTLKRDLDHAVAQNKPMVIEVGVEGGIALMDHYVNTLTIFICSDDKEREARIRKRHMDPRVAKDRLAEAKKEEAIARRRYDYIVMNMNEHPEDAVESVKELILKHYPQIATK